MPLTTALVRFQSGILFSTQYFFYPPKGQLSTQIERGSTACYILCCVHFTSCFPELQGKGGNDTFSRQ